eukprot:5894749-Pyramimonas_sp.AAC.1
MGFNLGLGSFFALLSSPSLLLPLPASLFLYRTRLAYWWLLRFVFRENRPVKARHHHHHHQKVSFPCARQRRATSTG